MKEPLELEENSMSNPFQCHSPVFGDDFYGRQNIINEILDDDRFSHGWILGARRSGKSSILRHIEHIAIKEKKYADKYIPIYWNFEGVNDVKGLKIRLLNGLSELESKEKEKYQIINFDIDKAVDMSIDEILHIIGRSIVRKNYQLLLLCDEVEKLVKISNTDDDILSSLRYYFQCNWTRTVIVATGALWNLKEKEKAESPFLSGFVPPIYTLCPLAKNEAIALLRTGENCGIETPSIFLWEDEICRVTNQMPYYMQLLCREIVYLKPSDFGDILNETINNNNIIKDFNIILENDLNGLNFIEKITLLAVVENPNLSLKDIKTRIKIEIGIEEKIPEVFRNLKLLGYINEISDHHFCVQNQFLQSWYRKNLRRIIEEEFEKYPKAADEAKNYPFRFGSSFLKFRELEEMIHIYIEKKYDFRFGAEGYFKKEKDFKTYIQNFSIQEKVLYFNDLIIFLSKAINENTPLNTMFRDKKEEKYRLNMLYLIRDIRNLFAHIDPPLADREIELLKLLCQEMIDFFKRIMPR